MIEIKDTRKTATKDPRPKSGDVVRIDKDYYLCVIHYNEGKLELNLYCLLYGSRWGKPVEANGKAEYVFKSIELENYDIEVITNKITLTIE